jgi:hypothetical protein
MAEREDEGMVVPPVESSYDVGTDPEARTSMLHDQIDASYVHCRRRAWAVWG